MYLNKISLFLDALVRTVLPYRDDVHAGVHTESSIDLRVSTIESLCAGMTEPCELVRRESARTSCHTHLTGAWNEQVLAVRSTYM